MSTVVWITGASSGIGAALAGTGPAGARIIGIARRPSASGESILADLSDPASWDGVGAQIEDVLSASRPDEALFLHFAGTVIPMGPATTADPAAYRAAVLVNSAAGQVLGAAFLAACERHAVAATVVMCSSPAATHPRSGMTHYAGGKAALEHWTRAVALEQEGAARPARVFSVVPYGVDTPMVRAAMEEPADTLPLGQYFREAAAAGRLTDPVTVAHEIWVLLDGGVEQGAAVAVGAVPDRG